MKWPEPGGTACVVVGQLNYVPATGCLFSATVKYSHAGLSTSLWNIVGGGGGRGVIRTVHMYPNQWVRYLFYCMYGVSLNGEVPTSLGNFLPPVGRHEISGGSIQLHRYVFKSIR
jgi:hypothetical protein